MLSAEAIRLYRLFLFDNADNPRPLPPGLIAMHERFWHMLYKYGQRSAVSPEMLTMCVLFWQQTTPDGQRFFSGEEEEWKPEPLPETLPVPEIKRGPGRPKRPDPGPRWKETSDEPVVTKINWEEIPKGTRVILQQYGDSIRGEFYGVINKYNIKVKLDGSGSVVRCSWQTVTLDIPEPITLVDEPDAVTSAG